MFQHADTAGRGGVPLVAAEQGTFSDRSMTVGPTAARNVAHRLVRGSGVIARSAYGSCPVFKESKPPSNNYLCSPVHR
ncbi:hypothetical protein GCM10010515_31250 [Streptomyces fructofermentans]|uniref:Uncharacterized protein n=1 Tax=Streptomyces fructofermentans TaxID=152141 RepID=A0A918KFU9_9ACTN|nr:hypothetical protein GCM10010515_31250 [Streptomyces fructofermentans]